MMRLKPDVACIRYGSRLLALQKLYVRLFFCDQTLRQFKKSPKGLLKKKKIPLVWSKYLPNVRSENFQAESRGRRFLTAIEVRHYFIYTFGYLLRKGKRVANEDVLNSRVFRSFISSDHFFLPQYGLFHASSVGKGYEIPSKFYQWMKNVYLKKVDKRNHRLYNLLREDFALYVLEQAKNSNDVRFQKLLNGIFFKCVALKKSSYEIIESDHSAYRVTGMTAQALSKEGFVNLDTFT
jgi:hypothetical protein